MEHARSGPDLGRSTGDSKAQTAEAVHPALLAETIIMPLAHAVVSAASAASVAFAHYNEQHPSPTHEVIFRHAEWQYQVPNSSPTAKRVLSPPSTSVRLAAHCWRTPYADFVDYRRRTLDYDALRITRKVWWRTANELERALDEPSIDARRQFWTEGVVPALKDAGFLSDGPEPGSAEHVRAIVQQYRAYMDYLDAVLETWAALQDHLQALSLGQLTADDASSELVSLETDFLGALDEMYAACGGMPCYPEQGPRDAAQPWASDDECAARDDAEAHARGGRRTRGVWVPT